MAYPNSVDQFNEKLNKRADESNYAIEEVIKTHAGKYEKWLAHDNIVTNSINVYTGPKLTGREVTTWSLSSSAEMPWKRQIRIFDSAPILYISYETPGDTVEAEDINILQTSLITTQVEIERYKFEGVIDGGSFNEGE
ncbi:phosphoglucomutase [Paenibacillus sp. GSMTC-2017]|uniref:phosphoglucomutase n=1 Tax=Paenibacillus sp. GSMTC-2017 TaxID=2794350 RepID=UPI0018D6A110|nr:phosphoglucomutase [Paenibacillus sp. GSMTC-2017]MBH5316696.1 phosphoglucomutase [Paenibacillus sp. GSMTC-2017]